MSEKIKLEIVTPGAIVVSDEVDEMFASGTEGEFGVLPGHCAMLSSLKIGAVNYKKEGKTTYLAVSGGYAEVGPDRVTILAEAAELSGDINKERAREALERLEEAANNLAVDDPAYASATRALDRARNRLEIAGK